MIIGEVAQAHDGSLGTAHAYIDAIANVGADAVKFQTHIAHAESTPAEPWRVKFSQQDAMRYDYWKRMEFTESQWQGLQQHAKERGLFFLSSPFSEEAVDLLTRVEVDAWKIASGEVRLGPMLDKMIATGLPIVLSSGMSSLAEVDAVAARLQEANVAFSVLQCTSAYPCPPEKIGLNLLDIYRERYACPVGLSDHSGTIYAGLAAVALGASLIEVHVTMSRELFGPDVPASLTTGELRQLVEGIRFIERMQTHPVAKDSMASELAPLRGLFTKSVVAAFDLPAGTRLERSHLAFKKPGTGIPSDQVETVLGRRLRQNVAADTLLQESDFE